MRVAEHAVEVIHAVLKKHGGGAHYVTIAAALRTGGFPDTPVTLKDKSSLSTAQVLGFSVVGDHAFIPRGH